jgi:hypothetical protein
MYGVTDSFGALNISPYGSQGVYLPRLADIYLLTSYNSDQAVREMLILRIQ